MKAVAIGLSCIIIDRKSSYKDMENSDLTIPCIQIRHDSAVCYDLWIGARRAPQEFEEHLTGARAKAYSGTVTKSAEKNIRKGVDLLLQATPKRIIYNTVTSTYHSFQVGFWTLTISDKKIQPHKDVARNCLIPFCNWMQKRKYLYLWKAELQERGQIHYHITVDQFCAFGEVRDQWNKLQRKAGYLDGYAKEHGHFNANSVDVHSVRNLVDIEAYLIKYICKNSKDKIDGKVWGCSRSLTSKRFSTEIDSSVWSNCLQHPLKNLEFCTIVKAPGKSLLGRSDSIQYQNFVQSLKS